MQMVKRIIGGLFLFILFFWLFAPKQELYYFLEKKLKENNNIIISNETITDTWFGINIKNADVYIEGAKMIHLSELKLNIFFFYNTLTINGIETDEVIHDVAPKNIENSIIKYSVLNPLKVQLLAIGSFGVLDGNVALLEKKVHIKIPVVKDIKALKKFLKKDEKGVWNYETNY